MAILAIVNDLLLSLVALEAEFQSNWQKAIKNVKYSRELTTQ
jgi:hypothetical protein